MPPDVAAAKKREIDRMWAELEEEEEDYLRRQKFLEAGPSDSSSSKKKANERQGIDSRAPTTTTAQPAPEAVNASNSDVPAKKKGVSFADGSAPRKTIDSTVEWGDVVPATLSGKRRKPIARATPIMKFGVVERTGKALEMGNRFAAPDSDDEEVGQEAEDEGSDEEGYGAEVQDSEEDTGRFEDADSDDEDEQVTALQQRVLSDYHAKRDVIFQRAQEAGLGTPPVRTGDGSGPPKVSYDDEFVPLDATPTNPHPTSGSGMSRFKSSHTGQPHSVTVRAIGPDAHETIREGKLVDGQLVAPADSDSDADGLTETGKQALDRLRTRAADDAVPLPQDASEEGQKSPAAEGGATHANPTPLAPRVSIGDVQERPSGNERPQPRAPPSASQKQSRFKVANNSPASGSTESPTDQTRRQGPSAPPSIVPTVIESPSFSSAPISSPNPSFMADRIMSRDIVERTPAPPRVLSTGGRVSRFKTDRL
ncbi:hypothetical protein FRC01_005731 [Tulasnella sp. 417]|nr:hypothetical protein FRC01_005731 [Tulasnella sp. 417]